MIFILILIPGIVSIMIISVYIYLYLCRYTYQLDTKYNYTEKVDYHDNISIIFIIVSINDYPTLNTYDQ